MLERVLITGGAGFIGSHLADQLVAAGFRVRLLDNLDPQVHGPERRRPRYLTAEAELVIGDVRDAEAVRRALAGVSAVVHLAARVGVGQSMYRVADYTGVNNLGTATLLEALSEHPIRRLVVASSMSVYGEGLYRRPGGGAPVPVAARSIEQLRRGAWEPRAEDGGPLEPIPTPESKPPHLESIYALSKLDQERMCLMLGRAYALPTVALRLFNVFGPRQALENPYTGVLAIFAARLLSGAPPLLFEDGLQRRDFVSVHDAARAFVMALTSDAAPGQVFNIGSGRQCTVREIAERMARCLGRPEIRPEVTGRCRVGDIRHCFADIAAARRGLGYAPEIAFERGLEELAAWLDGQRVRDRVEEAGAELAERGLTL